MHTALDTRGRSDAKVSKFRGDQSKQTEQRAASQISAQQQPWPNDHNSCGRENVFFLLQWLAAGRWASGDTHCTRGAAAFRIVQRAHNASATLPKCTRVGAHESSKVLVTRKPRDQPFPGAGCRRLGHAKPRGSQECVCISGLTEQIN